MAQEQPLETPTQDGDKTPSTRGPSLAIPKQTQEYNEDQDAPLLSIDYIHDSLPATNYGGVSKIVPDAEYTDEDRGGSQLSFNITSLPKRTRKQSFINQNKASIPSSVFNLCNTIVGAGILGLPEAVAQTGYIVSAFLFVAIAVINLFTLNLNLSCAKLLAPNSSYTTLCHATIPKLQYVVDASVAITCFGVCCAYFVVIGDLLPDVITQYVDSDSSDDQWYTTLAKDRITWILIYLFLFIMPTLRLRKMDSLRFTSFFALICFTYITIIVVIYFLIDPLDPCRS